MDLEKEINKDLILREKLAIQRTIMANQTTLLSFMRTSLYFLVAGLTIHNLFTRSEIRWIELLFYAISVFLLLAGIINFFVQRRKIEIGKKHIGDYKLEYLEKK